MDRAQYEAYESEADYDSMEQNPTESKAKAVEPSPPAEKEMSKKWKILLVVIALTLLLVLLGVGGGVIALLLRWNIEESVDCDVGPWGAWTSCYLPPGTCGVGKQNRTRNAVANATKNGEKCAKLRLIELAQTLACHVACNTPDAVAMLVRKQSENAEDFFNQDFKDYQDGFAANGESWIGLDKLHRLTSERSYSLKITMTDYDNKTFVAVYNNFKVGPGEDYVATVESFNDTLSTLGDSMRYCNGMKFSTKDRDQDGAGHHCAETHTGGFWYEACMHAHPTGLSSATKKNGKIYVTYYRGGDRGISWDSWSEAEYLLVPN